VVSVCGSASRRTAASAGLGVQRPQAADICSLWYRLSKPLCALCGATLVAAVTLVHRRVVPRGRKLRRESCPDHRVAAAPRCGPAISGRSRPAANRFFRGSMRAPTCQVRFGGDCHGSPQLRVIIPNAVRPLACRPERAASPRFVPRSRPSMQGSRFRFPLEGTSCPIVAGSQQPSRDGEPEGRPRIKGPVPDAGGRWVARGGALSLTSVAEIGDRPERQRYGKPGRFRPFLLCHIQNDLERRYLKGRFKKVRGGFICEETRNGFFSLGNVWGESPDF